MKSYDLLVDELRSSDHLVRRQACTDLGQLGDARAVPHLIEALSDRHEYVGAYAADALGILGDRAAIPALEAAVDNRDRFLVSTHAGGALKALQNASSSQRKAPQSKGRPGAKRADPEAMVADLKAKAEAYRVIFDEAKEAVAAFTAAVERAKSSSDPKAVADADAANEKARAAMERSATAKVEYETAKERTEAAVLGATEALLARCDKTSGTEKKTEAPPKSGCFVATACYGGSECDEVKILRKYRDNHLSKTGYGRLFMRLYYAGSPFVARRLENHPRIRAVVRKRVLDPLAMRLSRTTLSSGRPD